MFGDQGLIGFVAMTIFFGMVAGIVAQLIFGRRNRQTP